MLKRAFDISVVVLASPIWMPVLLGVALLVRFKLGRPVLFRQPRPGLQGRVFQICKFRTMIDARNGKGELLPDAERLTSFGQWLRATSLDELPELFNVLSGEMSLVGPRPLKVEYLSRYNARQVRRHDVVPGITGLAQVMGRNALSWSERFEWDLKYVDQYSFWLDIRILLLTVRSVLLRTGITAAGAATMPEFMPLKPADVSSEKAQPNV